MTYGGTRVRLITRFCVIGLPVYLALCALMIGVYQDHRRQGLEEEIAAETAATSAALAAGLGSYLARDDSKGAASLLAMARGSRAIRCVRVETDTRPSFALWPGYPCDLAAEQHSLTVPIRNDGLILGQLTAHFGTDWATTKLEREAGFVYGATAIGTLGALIAFVVAFHFAIGRRVAALHAAIQYKRDTGQDRAVRDLVKDDLGAVARAYDSMLATVKVQQDAIDRERRRRIDLENRAAAERAEREARTRFLEAASHELRTPLNGILGASHALAGPNLTARQKRSVLLLRDAVETMETTVSEILREANRTRAQAEHGAADPFRERHEDP